MKKILPRFNYKNFRYRKNHKQILGIILAVIGAIIVIQVIPLSIWLFLLGLLLLALGWTFFKML